MKPVRQQALSLVVPLSLGQEAQLELWLEQNRGALRRALARSTTTHFARWVLLPPTPDEQGHLVGDRHLLAFETNFDGELPSHVADLQKALGPLLDGAFAGAEGFPGGHDLAKLTEFLRSNSLRAAAFYVAHGGLSVPVVRGDAKLKRAVEGRLRELSESGQIEGRDAMTLARELQRTALVFADRHGLRLGWLDRGLNANPRGVLARALMRPLGVAWAFLLAPFFEFRDELARRRQPNFQTPELRAKRDAIGLQEDRGGQNGLTHLVAVKPGWYRSFVLKVMMNLVGALVDAGALTGRLGGIQTIHFARWVLLPDRRLLFCSNYDGSWESYLGEFIGQASRGLTMIWSSTIWFPKTRLLLFKGAKDEEAFKEWTRAWQLPTQVWYSAYPGLSVNDVLKNAQLRELLGSTLDRAKAARLLGLL